jgi:hypothetical protein
VALDEVVRAGLELSGYSAFDKIADVVRTEFNTASASTPRAWSESAPGDYSVVRVAEGGKVLQRVELAENRAPFALMLGVPNGGLCLSCPLNGARPTAW